MNETVAADAEDGKNVCRRWMRNARYGLKARDTNNDGTRAFGRWHIPRGTDAPKARLFQMK